MLAHELQVRAVSDRGEEFGLNAQAAIDVLGLKASVDGEIFERFLEDACESLSMGEAEHDLFCAEARLAFYGLMTDRASIARWNRVRDAASADMLADLAGDEEDQIADYRAELERA